MHIFLCRFLNRPLADQLELLFIDRYLSLDICDLFLFALQIQAKLFCYGPLSFGLLFGCITLFLETFLGSLQLFDLLIFLSADVGHDMH